MSLPRQPLTTGDLAAIDTIAFRAFTRLEAIHVAEAWNAGAGARAIAQEIDKGVRSVCMLMGVLTQAGVALRTDGRLIARAPRAPRVKRAQVPARVAARDRELEYFRLREAKLSSLEAAAQMGLSSAARDRLEGYWSAEKRLTPSNDGSEPKFAHHAEHVVCVMKAGGFPFLSERRGPRGHIVAVPPLLWPVGAAA